MSTLYIKGLFFHLTSKAPYLNKNKFSSEFDITKLLYCKNEEFSFLYDKCKFSNPFSEPHPENIKLKITNVNRFVILRPIFHTVLKCSGKDIFYWSCTKFHEGGISFEELELLWNMTYKYQIRNNKFQSKKQIS